MYLRNCARRAAEPRRDLECARLGPEAERLPDLFGHSVAASARVPGAEHELVLPQSTHQTQLWIVLIVNRARNAYFNKLFCCTLYINTYTE